ncbi:glutaredoxin 2 [Celerinatantimonas diazotrophica]|uniref:Glutaredoxin 2 n=1 Tax=Celerinatantimonas diazotrophica TaxID=412034 RepID=A0A4R1K9M1_9GAMM|nr:glutaredoxin 2 [Celerinatantimonas diazotrophica]TCK61082.1 glutaredoxin 2 [Celerinatantimonas diazotrophica]CAG9295129.1 Glutaredoxin 2 [Celerinatantimonas diazotrophica]
MKLHQYDHCPFCVKARMIFGLKGIPVTLNILLNDDVDTPTAMIGKKMVPILEKEDGSFMPESMDIVHWIDRLDGQPLISQRHNQELSKWLDDNHFLVNQLVMPRTPHLPFAEFATESARAYYTNAKQNILGDFKELLTQTDDYLERINKALVQLNSWIACERGVNGELSEDDFHLFATLRSLSGVKGIVYPEKVETYRQKMASLCDVPLMDEYAI